MDLGSMFQHMIVMDPPNECLHCHSFGHQVRACPQFMQGEPQLSPSLEVAANTLARDQMEEPLGGGGVD